MYDRRFGTDWDPDALTREEAIDRAFALGVAAGCGSERPTELDRLLEAFPSTYDRGLVSLAYDEGRTRALERPVETPEAVWTRLVDADGTSRHMPVSPTYPRVVGEPLPPCRPPRGAPPSLALPPFLRK